MERFRNTIALVLERFASVLLVVIMLITVVDVVFRYLLGNPLAASFELTEILLSVMIFASIAVAMARDDHIEVTLLEPLLVRVPRFRRGAYIAFRLMIAAAFLGLGLWVFELGNGKWVEFTPVMHLPLAPVAWLVALALLVAACLSALSVIVKRPVPDD